MAGQMRFFPEALNSMSFEQRKEHKEKLLRDSVRYMVDNSPEYYAARMKDVGAEVGDIKTIEDLRALPVLMDKDAERVSMETSLEKYGHPFGLHVCCDPADVVSTGGTSGTTGHPTYPYTQTAEDVDLSSEVIAFMHNEILGLGRGDRAFFLFPLGVYATSVLIPGIRRAGICPLDIDIRLGTKPALELVKWTKPTFWWTGAAIVKHYIEAYKGYLNIDPRDLGFKALVLTGEMGCGIPELKKEVEAAYGCRWFDFWGPSLTSISLSCDSDEYHGLHNFCDDFDICYEDLVDPATKQPVEITDGAEGETVVTHLRKKASPYFKYATGDIVRVSTTECPGCGFKGYRAEVIGRADDMVTVKGVNVFGRAILQAVQKLVPKITGRMRIIKDDPSPRVTRLRLKLEYGEGMGGDLDALAAEVKAFMKEELRVNPEIEWTEPGSLQTQLHKQPMFEKRY